MKLLFIADGRSPTALNWIRHFVDTGHEVHLVSSYPCAPELALASLNVVPVAFSSLAGEFIEKGIRDKRKGGLIYRFVPLETRTMARQWLGPLTLPSAAKRLWNVLIRLQPDLIHAIRIPYEGMLAALAMVRYGGRHPSGIKMKPSEPPFVLSVWGNDFTLHAPANPWMAHYTRLALRNADLLHTDCYRDERLAHFWGYAADKPAMVLPGGGGVQMDTFYPPENFPEGIEDGGRQPLKDFTVINPRGLRAYVRNDIFFQAIPLVLERQPQTRFLCPAMAGEPQVDRWLKELGIAESVRLLPRQPRDKMAELFRQAQVVVSPSTHDGTPNTLLEAMACGCFPVVGDIEPLREWIVNGVNGLLVDPNNPEDVAKAILRAIEQPSFRARAAAQNVRLIAERAEYSQVMAQAEGCYRKLILRPQTIG